MSSGAGPGKPVHGLGVDVGVVDIDDQQVAPVQPSTSPVVVIAAIGAASASMNSIRAAGCAGSIGRYAAPVLSTARIATIASADRDNSSATRCPGPAPCAANRCANRFAASSSSRYVKERPSKLSATASGARATCAANTAGIDTDADAGWVNTARLPTHPAGRAHRHPAHPSTTAAASGRRSSPPTPALTALLNPGYRNSKTIAQHPAS